MNYLERLKESSNRVGNFACMGLDPICETNQIVPYFERLFKEMKKDNLIPAAFKPNIGFYTVLDHPREGNFSGSKALSTVLDLVSKYFPKIPVILDSKRGDIARSSKNYSIEAFENWGVDATTISPFMGIDSVEPFQMKDKCAYILNRTSNKGGKDFQDLKLKNNDTLFTAVSKKIIEWNKIDNDSTFGAVAGATNMNELAQISYMFADNNIPLLIPGVGSQGGSATEVRHTLLATGYPLHLARVNSSSKLTHPWKKAFIPEDAVDLCMANIKILLKELEL